MILRNKYRNLTYFLEKGKTNFHILKMLISLKHSWNDSYLFFLDSFGPTSWIEPQIFWLVLFLVPDGLLGSLAGATHETRHRRWCRSFRCTGSHRHFVVKCLCVLDIFWVFSVLGVSFLFLIYFLYYMQINKVSFTLMLQTIFLSTNSFQSNQNLSKVFD